MTDNAAVKMTSVAATVRQQISGLRRLQLGRAIASALLLLAACATEGVPPPSPPANIPASSPAAQPAELVSLRLLEAFQGARGPERPDVQMQTTRWEKVPRVLRTSTTPLVIQSSRHRVTLAGDAAGGRDFRIDNFILLEVMDGGGRLVATGLVGNVVDCTGPVLLGGQPVPELGPKAFTVPAGAVDLSAMLPVGRPFVLRATGLDYGGAAFLSEVYLVVN